MRSQYLFSLVGLSYVVAVVASHVTLELAARLRDSYQRSAALWIIGGALSMGVGIWSMHFIGMLAFRLPIEVLYDLPLTALSFLIAVLVSGLALFTFRRQDTSALNLLLPGTLIGLGIAAMHYTGMAAIKLVPAVRYDPILFIVSVLIAIGAAITALWIAFNLKARTPTRLALAKFASALVMGAAIVGMHYTGMAAVTIDIGSICIQDGLRLDTTLMAYTLGGVSIILLTTTMLLALYDARMSSAIARSADELRRANEALERRVAERTLNLAREEARKSAILRAALDCVITIDHLGRVIEFNPAAETTFHYSMRTAIGQPIEALIVPDKIRLRIEGSVPDYLRKHREQLIGRRFESVALRRGGEEFPVEIAIAEVSLGDATFYTVYLRDITERKQVEQALTAAKEAAEAGSRAKSAFLATMSHEIRTPMNAVIGMLELLALGDLDADQRETLAIVRDSSRSLLLLIDDILDFSKIEAGKLEILPQPNALKAIAEGVGNTFRSVASAKGLVLACHFDATVAAAHQVDGLRLRQVLSNFLSNAVKFTAQGQITFSVRVLESDDQRQHLQFSVKDTGPGIDVDTLERLFQPFEQGDSNTNRRYGGTGLGLAISRRLAEAMGGRIVLESTCGQGTTVTLDLTLPLAASEAVLDVHHPVRVPLSSSSHAGAEALCDVAATTLPLLIVDDHPTNLRLLMRQVGILGYQAESAAGGVEALRKWGEKSFALVITDCQMPEMDGYQLAQAIRRAEAEQMKPRVPIVAFTANSHREALDRCLQEGMDDYLVKPAELTTLAAKLRQWLPPRSQSALPAAGAAPAASSTLCASPVAAVLLELAGGDHAVIGEVAEEFIESVQADVHAADEALRRADLTSAARAAHRIKGAARTIRAADLAESAQRFENAVREGIAEHLGDELARLVRETTKLFAQLQDIEVAHAA